VALTQLLSVSLPETTFDSAAPWSDSLRDAILETMYRSSSDELFLPVQDLFGWFNRINVPATVGEHNWTWKLPWPVDTLASQDAAIERQQTLRELSEAGQR
jgi:4-alpha-glucanotransferase